LPHSWLRISTGKYSATATILDSKIVGRGAVEHLFDINVKPEQSNRLLADIRGDKDVLEMETAESKGGRIHGSITTGRCTICKEVAKSKCFLATVVVSRGEARWTVMGSQEATEDLLTALEKRGVPFEVKLKRNLGDRELLTARQEEILLMAFVRGYFDFPKKVGLKDLASETGVKTSTLTEILRRGQKKILEEYFFSRQFLHPHQTP
jgi:predicted DNA binding protein